MSEQYTYEQHIAAVLALLRIRKKLVLLRALENNLPASIKAHPGAEQIVKLVVGIMEDFIIEVDRMISERDYQ